MVRTLINGRLLASRLFKFISMFRTTHFQLAEIIIGQQAAVTGTGNRVPFPQQPQLQSGMTNDENGLPRKVYIKAVECFSSAGMTFSPLTQNMPVASPFDITNAVLTLTEGTSENKRFIPLPVLNRAFASAPAFVPGSAPQLFLLKNVWEIDFVSSYVMTLGVPPVQPFSYLFGFHYSYEPDLF